MQIYGYRQCFTLAIHEHNAHTSRNAYANPGSPDAVGRIFIDTHKT